MNNISLYNFSNQQDLKDKSDIIYKETIKFLYNHLIDSDTFEKQYLKWKSEFTLLHGYLDTQRKIDFAKLSNEFKIRFIDDESIFKLIYCFETYYTIVLRVIAHNFIFKNKPITLQLFDNNYFKQAKILNYTCNDYLNWFKNISEFEIYLPIIEKSCSIFTQNIQTDFVKEIFESIFPTPVRHSMGEFYTPDWLANFVIETINENDEFSENKTYLDPSCGSGTFIFNVIKKYQNKSNNTIFNQVFGIDINPVSVLAAKTNYLILFSLYNDFNSELTIPIFYADTIHANATPNNLFAVKMNGFEDVSIPKVDYIIGNPPWVNWEYLPKEYKNNTVQLWQYYGLFNQKGMDAGFIKEDISVLLTYVVLDKYLKNNGKLGFVVKESLFKSVKQGESFRKFLIQPTNTPVKPYRVDDLTNLKPFKDATNKTVILFIEKNIKVNYPIDYIFWQPTNGKRFFDNNFNLNELKNYINFIPKKAKPSDEKNKNSGWITVADEDMKKTDAVLGKSEYQARTGTFTGGANGIFWMQILEKNNNSILVQNITERAKNKMQQIKIELETDFVFPFLTGNELNFWNYNYSKYILCPHTSETKMYPIDLKVLNNLPKTLNYFEIFKKELQERKGFTSFDKHIQEQSYYAIQRIGDYTFAKYKVAWRYISKDFTPAVIEYADDKNVGYKNIIPNEKIIFVGLDDKTEAYYLCGLLSSDLYRQTIKSYVVDTQITTSIINKLNLPKFDKENYLHIEISKSCELGHKSDEKQVFLNQINKLVEKMLNI